MDITFCVFILTCEPSPYKKINIPITKKNISNFSDLENEIGLKIPLRFFFAVGSILTAGMK